MRAIAGAAAAAGWLALAWYAVPLFGRRIEALPERLRQTLVLTVGVGALAGFTGLVRAPFCWGAVAFLAAVRAIRFRALPRAPASVPPSPVGIAAVIAATAFAAWPGLVRPLTDGDSLIYHIPNAAAWVHSGSVYATDTHYWWYPGGSELAAAVFLSVGGIAFAPLAGTAAYALLGLTTLAWSRERGLSERTATVLTLASITSLVAMVQAVDLQNDVWLAAFVAAAMRSLGRREPPAGGTLATLALLKPVGWLDALALVLVAPAGARRIPWLALGAFAAWAARDALLARGALVAAPAGLGPAARGTSIAAHGLEGLRVLGESALRDGPATTAALALAVAALALWRSRFGWLARLAAFELALFVFVPFGFESGGVAQLALGFTLRFGLPAMTAGTFAAATWLQAAPRAARALAAAACGLAVAANARRYLDLYWNDASVRGLVVAGLVAGALAWLGPRAPSRVAGLAAACALAAGFAYAWRVQDAASPVGYYRDALGESGRAASLPAFLATLHGGSVMAVGFPLGLLDVLAPDVRAIDGPYEGDACAAARRAGARLVVHAPETLAPSVRASLARCGHTVWRSGNDAAIDPARARGSAVPSAEQRSHG